MMNNIIRDCGSEVVIITREDIYVVTAAKSCGDDVYIFTRDDDNLRSRNRG